MTYEELLEDVRRWLGMSPPSYEKDETMKMHEGLPVPGYRTQTGEAVALVKENKEVEELVLRVLDKLRSLPPGPIDHRWLAIGRTQIEQGFMAVNRAVFQPERVKLEGDPS